MTNLIDTLQRAKEEIQILRRRNEILSAKVGAFELCAHLFYAQGPCGQGGESDVAHILGKHIEELQAAVAPNVHPAFDIRK